MAEDRSVLSRTAPPPDRTWAYDQHPDHVVEHYRGSRGQGPALALVHGGYWRPEYDRLHLRPMAAGLAAAGWDAYLIEYRRVPGQPGQATRDVQAAVASVIAAHGDAGVILIGHSAGGHLALHAASEGISGVVAVIALGPVADLGEALERDLDAGAARAFLGQERLDDYCPLRRTGPDLPVTILHGDDDELVPIDLSRGYARTHARTRLVELPDAGHFALIDPQSPAWAAVLTAIEAAADLAEGGP